MTAHRVDLEELVAVVAALSHDLASLESLAGLIESESVALDGRWTGLAHDSYAATRASFDAGFASMRSALALMESVAASARNSYAAAVDHNLGLWRELT